MPKAVRRLAPAFVLATCLVTWPGRGLAQAGLAELTGEVKSSDGTPLADCTITATEAATGRLFQVTSNRAAVFQLPPLRPGSYRIEAACSGFRPSVPQR